MTTGRVAGIDDGDAEIDGGPIDLAIVGGGVSGGLTLYHLLELHRRRHEAGAQPSRLSIALFDADGAFFGGLAYGRRSGESALTISPLAAAVPPDEVPDLIAYLTASRAAWSSRLAADPVALAWLRRNRAAVDRGDLGDLYVPRSLIAAYLNHRIGRAVDDAASRSSISVRRIEARVERIVRASGLFDLAFRRPDGTLDRIEARRCVLATGIPPPDSRPAALEPVVASPNYILNLYYPGLDENIDRLTHVVQARTAPVTIVVIGSNAGALDAAYQLRHRSDLADRIASVAFISPSGALPDPFDVDGGTEPTPRATLKLVERGCDSAEQLIGALLEDVAAFRAAAIPTSRYAAPTLRAVFAALGRTADLVRRGELLRAFMERYSPVVIRTLANSAGAEYLEAVRAFDAEGRLRRIAGRVEAVERQDDGRLSIAYAVAGAAEPAREAFDACIVCAGYPSLAKTRDPLLRALLVEPSLGLRPVESGRGFVVDDRFEAAPGFFVMGPLLSGLVHRGVASFDLENTARIWGLSRLLAEIIFEG